VCLVHTSALFQQIELCRSAAKLRGVGILKDLYPTKAL
jgi:hypothetical protein